MEIKDIENINRNNVLDLSNDEPDRTGVWYGKLQAIRQTDKAPDGTYNWLCLCKCLNTIEVSGDDLHLGLVKHCGCETPPEDVEDIVYERTPEFQKPMWMTQGQLDLLMLVVPGPLGKGMKIIDAARELNISVDAAKMKLRRFKTRFPEAWDRIEGMRSSMRRQYGSAGKLKSLGGVKSLESLIDNHGMGAVEDMIVDKF